MGIRLPAGTTTRYYNGDDPESLALVGNVADAAYKAKFPDEITISASDGYVYSSPGGQFRPNDFGLYDMHGNAWQWCSDWYQSGYYATSAIEDPQGPSTGSNHILRGGSWGSSAYRCRSSFRVAERPTSRSDMFGFRVVLKVDAETPAQKPVAAAAKSDPPSLPATPLRPARRRPIPWA